MNSFKTILIAMFVLALLLLVGANLGHAQTLDTGLMDLLDSENIQVMDTQKATSAEMVRVDYVDSKIYEAEQNEVIELRTPESQTYYNPETEKYTLKQYFRPIFTGDSNQFKIYSEIVTKDSYQQILTESLTQARRFRLKDILQVSIANALTATTSIANDTYLQSANPTTNSGTGADCTIGYSGGTYRCILDFTTPNLTGTITDVSYNAYRSWTTGGGCNAELHELTQSNWVENQATWNVYSTGNNWSSSGGDFTATVIDDLTAGTGLNYVTWNIYGTGADNAYTIDWNTEYNFLIKTTTESGTKGFNINTSEAASNLPYVEITYTEEEGGETATSTTCDMTAGTLDDDVISEYLLYFFYVILLFVILTMGYWIVDRFFHSLSGKKYD